MTMLWLLLSSIYVSAAAPAPWVNAFDIAVDGKPRAAFFDAGTSSILISLDGQDGARIDRFSLEGKLQEKAVMKGRGEAGPIRAYDVKIFWLSGGKLLASVPHARPLPLDVKFAGGGFSDVTVLRGGKPLVVGAAGLVSEDKVDASFAGATGVYQYLNDVYVLFGGGKLGRLGEKKSEKICQDCRWLERTSGGDWLFVEGKKLIRRVADKNATFLEFGSAPGRPAYVFQKDTRDDLVLVPLPEEGKVRAFRATREAAKP